MVQEREVLVIFYCSVTGENDELLGVDETPITEINWIAIDSTENKVRHFFPIHRCLALELY